MRNLKFTELLLVSHRQRRGKKIVFHPKVTVIKGPNDTGKSSLIKSIFYSLGATPAKLNRRWKDAKVSYLLKFQVDGSEYSIFRYGKFFSLFDNDSKLIGAYDSVTNQLGPILAELFNFRLTLLSREGEPKIPPPSYLFLPYYIDQDNGWTNNWSSFEKLSQFQNWRKDLVYYHTGVLPNRWYELKAKLKITQNEKEEYVNRENILKDILKRLEKQLSYASFDIDFQSYKNEINQLLNRCEKLKGKEEKYKNKLIEFETDRIRLEAQKDIVAHARLELIADYNYINAISDDHISCPTCGAIYSNAFAERFSIACDEDRCIDLLQSISIDLSMIKQKIDAHKNNLDDTVEELVEIEHILETKQGEITLKNLIENEGKREVFITLNKQLKDTQVTISHIDTNIRGINEELSGLSSSEHLNNIQRRYQTKIRQFLHSLNVTTADISDYKKIESSMKESGSDQPRAVLAYFFSILHTINEFGSSTFCPIVIDAPNQQEQDPLNHQMMLEFIMNNNIANSQLILSLVDDCGIDFGGSVIYTHEKNFALSSYEYKSVAEEVDPFANANLGLF